MFFPAREPHFFSVLCHDRPSSHDMPDKALNASPRKEPSWIFYCSDPKSGPKSPVSTVSYLVVSGHFQLLLRILSLGRIDASFRMRRVAFHSTLSIPMQGLETRNSQSNASDQVSSLPHLHDYSTPQYNLRHQSMLHNSPAFESKIMSLTATHNTRGALPRRFLFLSASIRPSRL
jgi:hypothetical protein